MTQLFAALYSHVQVTKLIWFSLTHAESLPAAGKPETGDSAGKEFDQHQLGGIYFTPAHHVRQYHWFVV